MNSYRYFAAIDSGDRSTGLAAVAVDDDGNPTKLLNAQTVVHDGGVDPTGRKTSTSRKAKSGAARRARRLHASRKKRLAALDQTIVGFGWPVVDLETFLDPYLPWKVRAELASTRVPSDQLGEKMSIAVRHIARHRGWRNPYSATDSLYVEAGPSENFEALRDEVANRLGRPLPADATVGQTVAALSLTMTPLRKLEKKEKNRAEDGLLVPFRLMQSDHASELRAIADAQNLSPETLHTLIRAVFAAKNPRDHSAQPPARDALPGQNGYRAPKASEAFQQFRIASVVANLRIIDNGDERVLTVDERARVYELLNTASAVRGVQWPDIAAVLDIDRANLKGTATINADGERPASSPPINVTHQIVSAAPIAAVRKWWATADAQSRAILVHDLSNSGFPSSEFTQAARESVDNLLEQLTPEELVKLDELSLPSGRAAYSVASLSAFRDRMLSTDDDLHAARKVLFDVDDSWAPPADPISAPVGNPAVDRVTKIVARWLKAMEAEYGTPAKVVVENTRDGFMSVKKAAAIDRDNNRRAQRNRDIEAQIQKDRGSESEVSFAERKRHLAVQRQNGQCGYCGSPIHAEPSSASPGSTLAEIDHIVPRKGPGATNRASNMIAICKRCNGSKSNVPFAMWAAGCNTPGVSVDAAIERVTHWLDDPALNKSATKNFKASVIARLKRADFDREDSRSLESVSWMANELRHRIEQHYRAVGADTRVEVYRGSITSAARHASGLEEGLAMIGGPGKTRLDRRHHAVDAAVIAMMTTSVARTLAERDALRAEDRFKTDPTVQWKTYRGSSPRAIENFDHWKVRMTRLEELLNTALTHDRIPVHQRLRLRLGNSGYHEEKIRPLAPKRVGDAFTLDEIDRASTPALWCALTRHPDFNTETGLPPSADRRIRVHDKRFTADDTVALFSADAAGVAVRGGWAMLGDSVHHARIYRIPGKKTEYAMLRVFAADLAKHRNDDLFTAAVPPQSISRRKASNHLRKALADGTAEYITWLVAGDELHLDPTPFTRGGITAVNRVFPGTVAWKIIGLRSEKQIALRPTQLASEGYPRFAEHNQRIPDSDKTSTNSIVEGEGWKPSLNTLLANGKVTVVRRDALGRPRLSSTRNLPVSVNLQ